MSSYQIPEGYKQTEVGVIPEDWSVTTLGEIGQSLIGLTYRPADTRDFGTLVLRSSNVQNDRLAYENNVFVDSSLPLPSRVIVEEGDILICVRNGSKQLIGKCALIDEEAAGSAFGAFMSVFRTRNSSFIFYQFQSEIIQRQINEIMGATINQITTKDLVAFQIPLPPSEEEQRAIATALSDVDALIAALDKLIAKQRHLKTATMQQLLTGKKRLPGFGEGKGYKQTEVGVIPDDWEVRQLEEITDVDPENLGSTTHPEYEFKYISLEDVTCGVLNNYSEQIFSSSPSRARRVLQKGDVLLSTVRPNLKSHLIFQEAGTGWVCSTGFAVLRSKEGLSISEFLFPHLFSGNIDRQIETLIAGSNYPAINSGDVKRLEIPVPPVEEQRAIATVLSDMDGAISALEARRAKTQAIKQGMMQELLTGRTRLV